MNKRAVYQLQIQLIYACIYLLISPSRKNTNLPLNQLYSRLTTYVSVHHTYFTALPAASPIVPITLKGYLTHIYL
jgi:hypothetical protein